MQLLERDPLARPSAAEIFEALGEARTPQDAWMPAATEGRLFVGRRVELGLLDAALEASRRTAVAVVIAGESGVGKTALADHFCEVVRATRKKAVILHGRCHQRERVAFFAFDGFVHELARWLISRPDARAAQLVSIVGRRARRGLPRFARGAGVRGGADGRSRRSGGHASADLRDRAFMARCASLLVAIAHARPCRPRDRRPAVGRRRQPQVARGAAPTSAAARPSRTRRCS